MRDLKHMIYFDSLLQDANNALVDEACAAGRLAFGYTCYYIPEVLLNLPGCFSVRLRAPRSTSPDIATYYMSPRTCLFSRSILERAIEGGYNFLSGAFGTETCAQMDRSWEHWEQLNLVKKNNPKFFCTHLDAPLKTTEAAEKHYRIQLEAKVLKPLAENYGVDISDAAIRDAIARHNEVCRVITEIGNLRKADNPVITGHEFHMIQLVSQCCPQDLILPLLKETLEELKTREPNEKPEFRARLVLTGGEIDDPDFTKLLESCGALVVADRFCYGSLPGREPIEIGENETALEAVARHYLQTNQCPRFMSHDKVAGRKEYIRDLVREYKADGILIEVMKFCEFWAYEKTLDQYVFVNDFNIPCVGIEKDYTTASAGQLRTRFQAFIESVEIKKIQRGARQE